MAKGLKLYELRQGKQIMQFILELVNRVTMLELFMTRMFEPAVRFSLAYSCCSLLLSTDYWRALETVIYNKQICKHFSKLSLDRAQFQSHTSSALILVQQCNTEKTTTVNFNCSSTDGYYSYHHYSCEVRTKLGLSSFK